MRMQHNSNEAMTKNHFSFLRLHRRRHLFIVSCPYDMYGGGDDDDDDVIVVALDVLLSF